MINMLIQLLSGVLIYFLIKGLLYYIIEVKYLIPKFLEYPPYICLKCATFWTSLFVFGFIAITLSIPTAVIGIMLAILDAIAMHIHQKNKTMLLEEWEEYEKMKNDGN